MNAGRDVERLIADWLVEEAVLRAPDRILDGAGRVVDRTKQRRLGAAWRAIPMSAPLRLAAAAAIGVLAIGGGLFLIGRAGGPNIGPPAASASPSSSPTSVPTPIVVPTPSSGLPEGALAPGTYVATPFVPGPVLFCMTPTQPGCSEAEDNSIRASFTVPDGWGTLAPYAVGLQDEDTTSPGGAAMGFNRGGWLYSDPCLTPELRAANVKPEVAVGPTADEFANAIADHPLLDATDPVTVTLGGYSGKYVDLQLPTDLTGCETDYRPWEPGIYAQGPGHRWQLWILDLEGIRVVVAAMDYATTSAQNHAELEAIVQSIQFLP